MVTTQTNIGVSKVDALLRKMQSIVKKRVEYFESDFEYDIDTIRNIAADKTQNPKLYWIVRSSGTQLGYVQNLCEKAYCYNEYVYFINDERCKYFYVDVHNGTLTPIQNRKEFLRQQIAKYERKGA